jgi:hypothetical protein
MCHIKIKYILGKAYYMLVWGLSYGRPPFYIMLNRHVISNSSGIIGQCSALVRQVHMNHNIFIFLISIGNLPGQNMNTTAMYDDDLVLLSVSAPSALQADPRVTMFGRRSRSEDAPDE